MVKIKLTKEVNMYSIAIILEFESDKKAEIEKDIYSEERGFVDFNVLLPCPQELETQVAGSTEEAGVRVVKNHGQTFDINSATVRDEIRAFIELHREEEVFLRDTYCNEKNMESLIDSVIAYQKYGYGNWMDFKIRNWGVSQNAFVYEGKQRSKAGGFYFVASGSIPVLWLKTLSAKWPDVEFKVYATALMDDVSRGGYVKLYIFKDGDYSCAGSVKRKF